VTNNFQTNHIPPTNSPYQLLTLHVNVGSQPNTFLISLNNAHLKPFLPSTLNNAHIHDQTPKRACNFHLKLLALHVDVNLPFERLVHHQCSYQGCNSSNPNLHDHHGPLPSFTPTPIALTWSWVWTLDFFKSFHLSFHCPQLYICIPTTLQHDV